MGSNRAQDAAKQKIVFLGGLFCSCIYRCFRGVRLFQNGELKIPDRLQVFLEHVWNDQNETEYGPWTPFITKIIQKIQEHIWEHLWTILFSYMRI